MEGKLTLLMFFLLCFVLGRCVLGKDVPFEIVVFMCVWKRPLLTKFVLTHFQLMKTDLWNEDHIKLQLFIIGSDNTTIPMLANQLADGYAIHPNNPVGAKHDNGLQSLGAFYKQQMVDGIRDSLPHAVTMFGSDDIVNKQFFRYVKQKMHNQSPGYHVLGIRDIFFYDLKTQKLVYTKGYKSFKTPLSGTIGCGRVMSWSILDTLDWHLWDRTRDRGLDQSATRNVMKSIPFIGEVSEAIPGLDNNIVTIDIKSDGYSAGTNIWRFEQVVEAVGKNGRFHNFEQHDEKSVFTNAFGSEILSRLDQLRQQMIQSEYQ